MGGVGRVLAHDPHEPTQVARTTAPAAAQERHVRLRLRDALDRPSLLDVEHALREGALALAARWPMTRIRHPFVPTIDSSSMARDEPRTLEDLDRAQRLAHLHPASDHLPGDRVAIAPYVDVALGVDDALVDPVNLGHVQRQTAQMQSLGGEELARTGVQVTPRTSIVAIAPSPRLGVQRLPIRETTPGEEVSLDVTERSLDMRRAIRVPHGVRANSEAEALCEGRHLGRGARAHRSGRPCTRNE